MDSPSLEIGSTVAYVRDNGLWVSAGRIKASNRDVERRDAIVRGRWRGYRMEEERSDPATMGSFDQRYVCGAEKRQIKAVFESSAVLGSKVICIESEDSNLMNDDGLAEVDIHVSVTVSSIICGQADWPEGWLY